MGTCQSSRSASGQAPSGLMCRICQLPWQGLWQGHIFVNALKSSGCTSDSMDTAKEGDQKPEKLTRIQQGSCNTACELNFVLPCVIQLFTPVQMT